MFPSHRTPHLTSNSCKSFKSKYSSISLNNADLLTFVLLPYKYILYYLYNFHTF